MFDGQDKIVCHSLLSWVNDGSHNADDDLYITTDDGSIDNYLDIFKRIFDKSGHISHYNMMMGYVVDEIVQNEEASGD